MKPKKPIESLILTLRGQKVILDADLAELYGVPTKVFNQAVKRNAERFPEDFKFQLTATEFASLQLQIVTASRDDSPMRSQIVTASKRNIRYRPNAFTEHGAIMAATVLNSDQAVEMSVFVVRAFVRLREVLAANRELAARLDDLEEHLETHGGTIQEILHVVRKLMSPPPSRRRKIGFALPPAPAV